MHDHDKDKDKNESNFKSLLDQQYQFPCHYIFKFVVTAGQRSTVMELLGASSLIQERPSKTGKYRGLTLSRWVQSSDEVIALYQRVATIEGVISL